MKLLITPGQWIRCSSDRDTPYPCLCRIMARVDVASNFPRALPYQSNCALPWYIDQPMLGQYEPKATAHRNDTTHVGRYDTSHSIAIELSCLPD
jgi:hypothetical protein